MPFKLNPFTGKFDYYEESELATLFNNVKLIRTIADLPTPSGGKYTLLANTTYFFDSATFVLGTNYLECQNGTVIRGQSSFNTTLVYSGTGAAIRGIDGNCSFSFFTISSPKAFDFTNTARDKFLSFQNIVVANQTSASTVVGYKTNIHWLINYVGNVGGWSFIDNGFVILENQNFDDTNTGTQITINPQTYTKVNISLCEFVVNTGVTGINVTSTNILSGLINGSVFSGTAVVSSRLVGINGNTTGWTIRKGANIGIAGITQQYLAVLLDTTTATTTLPTYTSTGGTRLLLAANQYTENGTDVRVTLNVAVSTNNTNSDVAVHLYNRTTNSFVVGADFVVSTPVANTIYVQSGPQLTLTTGHVYEVLLARTSTIGNPTVTMYNSEFNLIAY